MGECVKKLPQEVSNPNESWGIKARDLWDRTFAEFANTPPNKIQILNTGIGGAPAGVKDGYVRVYPDSSVIPGYVDLQKTFGEVPEILFLVASPKLADDVTALKTEALHYKEQGVKRIVAVMTSLAHERQDHQFNDKNGNPISEGTTLKTVISDLAGSMYIKKPDGEEINERVIDAGMLLQPHSLRPIELGLREELPILPIDAFDFMIAHAGLDNIQNGYVVGPDKGRRDEGRKLAERMGWKITAATKTRDRLNDGKPTVEIPGEALDYIKDNKCTVVVFDDEIREGGTIKEIAAQVDNLIVIAVKMVCANNAISNLSHPNIKRIVCSDAVESLNALNPIWHKIKPVFLMEDIRKLIDSLKNNLTSKGSEKWLTPEVTGTLLKLDTSVEVYE